MEKRNPLGATGETVRANVRRLREAQSLGYAELSRRLKATGRGIAELGLRRIEEGQRRIDTDDLMALAAALGVSPVTLLMPPTTDPDETADATVGTVSAGQLWRWLTAETPLTGDAVSEVFAFIARSVPDWALGTEYNLVASGLSPNIAYTVERRKRRVSDQSGDDHGDD